MRCPRCAGDLVTFAVEGTAGTAVVCEDCGFADTPASHRPEGSESESWDEAIARFDEAVPRDRTSQTIRIERAPTPSSIDETYTSFDPDRLDETVTVAASLRATDRHESAPDEEGTEPPD